MYDLGNTAIYLINKRLMVFCVRPVLGLDPRLSQNNWQRLPVGPTAPDSSGAPSVLPPENSRPQPPARLARCFHQDIAQAVVRPDQACGLAYEVLNALASSWSALMPIS